MMYCNDCGSDTKYNCVCLIEFDCANCEKLVKRRKVVQDDLEKKYKKHRPWINESKLFCSGPCAGVSRRKETNLKTRIDDPTSRKLDLSNFKGGA